MGLLDKLREVQDFPPSHIPTLAELPQVLGLLIAHVDHGDALFDAIEQDAQARAAGELTSPTAVDDLLSPPDQASPSAAPSAAPAGEDPQTRVARLEQELATARADAQRTQVSVEPGASAVEPAGADVPPPTPEVL